MLPRGGQCGWNSPGLVTDGTESTVRWKRETITTRLENEDI